MRSATARAEEQARRIETVARGEAAEIVAEAEARATARTRQIEQWAEQVVSHTRAEEARLLHEQQQAKEAVPGGAPGPLRPAGPRHRLAERPAGGPGPGRRTGREGSRRRRRGVSDQARPGHRRPFEQWRRRLSQHRGRDRAGQQPGRPVEPGRPDRPCAQTSSGAQTARAQTSGDDQVGAAEPEGDHLDATVATLLNGGATETEQFEAKLDAWVAGGPEDRIG